MTGLIRGKRVIYQPEMIAPWSLTAFLGKLGTIGETNGDTCIVHMDSGKQITACADSLQEAAWSA